MTALNVALHSRFNIVKEEFTGVIIKNEKGIIIKTAWDKNSVFALDNILSHFGIELPDFLKFEIEVKECSITYETYSQKLTLTLDSENYGKLNVSSEKINGIRFYSLKYEMQKYFLLEYVPVIGKLASYGDGIFFKSFTVEKSAVNPLKISLDSEFNICGNNIKLPLDNGSKDTASVFAFGSDSNKAEEPKITWVNVNANLKVLYIKRIGFSFEKSVVKLLVDAKIKIAILELEFYEMFVSMDISGNWAIDYGLSGLMVKVDKPPITIAGGLYKASGKTLYNGKLLIKISKFTLTALGSYGETENGKASFFAFLALNYPLGGPPFLFVTGLALGFGINRKLKLPELNQIKNFPLVAALTGGSAGKGLNENTEASDALNILSDWIYVSEGDYFVTAGIQFKSFGQINTTALISVEFGNSLRISVLGLSTVSVPPNIASGKSPIAYAELAIRAVIIPEEGIYEVIGVLTKESYLFDTACHLTGGFAFCSWTKGQWAGDFLVTLGGCHHKFFKNKHYPVLDKVGINWVISSNLSVKGGGYFALTPNCLMAGLGMELLYQKGNLKAWLKAGAECYIEWKPFFYDIEIWVSVGASYKLDLWLFSKTFKIELGASLHIWGPKFAGSLHVEWFIISFTIRFGNQSSKPNPISFDEFKKSFLPENILDCTISGGLIKDDKNVKILNAYDMELNVRTAIPCTSVSLNSNQVKDYTEGLGIYPTGKKDLSSACNVSLVKILPDGAREVIHNELNYSIQNENISPALWSAHSPDINALPIKDVPTGLVIKTVRKEPSVMLPAANRKYDLNTLLESECVLSKKLNWGSEVLRKPVDYTKRTSMEEITKTIGKTGSGSKMMSLAAKAAKIDDFTNIGSIGGHPEQYFYDEPKLQTIGA